LATKYFAIFEARLSGDIEYFGCLMATNFIRIGHGHNPHFIRML